jgi:hypothetical protein
MLDIVSKSYSIGTMEMLDEHEEYPDRGSFRDRYTDLGELYAVMRGENVHA